MCECAGWHARVWFGSNEGDARVATQHVRQKGRVSALTGGTCAGQRKRASKKTNVMRRKHLGEAVEAQQIKLETVHASPAPPAPSHLPPQACARWVSFREPGFAERTQRAHGEIGERTRSRASHVRTCDETVYGVEGNYSRQQACFSYINRHALVTSTDMH